ncbi:MAG: hypothetical protein ACYDEJ_05800 [Desulfitobacteriaceae bacterium]
MNLLGMILFEGLLIAAAGITFVSGVWGMIIAAGLVSVINFMTHEMVDFWKWEALLILGLTIGILVLSGLNYKARRVKTVYGLVGGILSLVTFGAFITPVLALVLWVLVIGTGLIPATSRNKLFWGFASSIWRAILGLGWIIFGNSFFS